MRQTGFGLAVEAPQLLPGLKAVAEEGPAEVVITFEPTLDTAYWSQGTWRAAGPPSEGQEPQLQIHRPAAPPAVDAGYWRFRYGDETVFLVSKEGDRVRCAWREPNTLDDMVTYLLGPILGFVLHLRGMTALHASAVEVDGQAIAFAADAGTGKSTTAAAFAQAGFRVLTDDVCVLTEDKGMYVQPSYPRLRLWPDAVEGLFGRADALPPLTPNWDKLGFDLEEAHRQERAPLAEIFLLTYGPPDDADVPRIEPAGERTGLLELIRHVYGHSFADREGRARDFDLLARVVERVPVSWLYLPHGIAGLGAVTEHVAAHVARRKRAKKEEQA